MNATANQSCYPHEPCIRYACIRILEHTYIVQRLLDFFPSFLFKRFFFHSFFCVRKIIKCLHTSKHYTILIYLGKNNVGAFGDRFKRATNFASLFFLPHFLERKITIFFLSSSSSSSCFLLVSLFGIM